MDPNDPFGDLVPANGPTDNRVGYIPGVPKAPQPPSGYRSDGKGGFEIIPGGPADPYRSGGEYDPNKPKKPGEANQSEQTAAFLTTRLLGALGRITTATKNDPSAAKPPILPKVLGAINEDLGNYATSSDRQAVEAAQLDAIDAALTLGTGAAYTPDQLRSYRKAYFPQLGDSDATIKSKQQAFSTLIEAAKLKAGNAAPQIDQALAAAGVAPSGAPSQTQGGFGLKQDPNIKELSPEQAAAYDAFWKANPNPTPAQLKAFGSTININIGNAEDIIKAKKQGRGISHDVNAQDPRVQERINQYMQNGGGAGNAALAGFGDAATLGSLDELGGAAQALGGSLAGQGSFSDLYNLNSQANRGYEQQLQNEHPIAFGAGQVGGSFALPTFGASGAVDLAKLGAAYGGAYGFNSADGGLVDRLGNAATGAVAGGATGYLIPRGIEALKGRGAGGAVPELVDPATGALNQPLEAMTPGQRVQAANQFGVNLPMDSAGGRTAAVIGKGLDIMPGSAGVMEDARRTTEQQVANAADQVASRFGASRTLSEGGAELQRGANERIERGKGVISKAYNAIPISDTAAASNTNAVAALQQLTGRFASNPDLADAVRDPRLVTYLNAIEKGGLSWRDLKDFRSLVGEKIGDMRFGEGHSTQDLRALYGALSEDMRNTAAAQGPRAIRAFERANNLNRENQSIIEGALTRILGPDGKMSPEKAAAAVQAMTKGGKSTGDIKTLAQIRSATVKSGAWDEIASTLIRLGGQPANSQGRDFNPQTFVNWYSDMSEPARNLLFGKTELRSALDQFTAVNQRLMKVNALRNTSNTAGAMMAGSTVGALGAFLVNPLLGMKVLAVGAGNYGMAKVWTNPGFVRWATGMSRATTTPAARAQVGRLGKLAATNPEIREPLISLQRSLLGAMNDNVATPLAASPGGAEDQNQNNY